MVDSFFGDMRFKPKHPGGFDLHYVWLPNDLD
jgi:hypothetical protein